MSQERQTITIDEVAFYLDSLDDESKSLVQNINIINAEVEHNQIKLQIAKIAYDTLLANLKAKTGSFEPVPQTEPSK